MNNKKQGQHLLFIFFMQCTFTTINHILALSKPTKQTNEQNE